MGPGTRAGHDAEPGTGANTRHGAGHEAVHGAESHEVNHGVAHRYVDATEDCGILTGNGRVEREGNNAANEVKSIKRSLKSNIKTIIYIPIVTMFFCNFNLKMF